MIVPNSILFKNPVTTRTHQTSPRITVICGVVYDVDVDEAREVISKAVATCESVRQDDKPIQIFAQIQTRLCAVLGFIGLCDFDSVEKELVFRRKHP